MLITNPLYSSIDLYVRKINQYLNNGSVLVCDCKTYDKSQEDIVMFKCFDINLAIKTSSDFILSEVRYFGQLEFSYNKSTNEVFVLQLPYIYEGKTQIPVLTSDIAKLIVEKLASYLPKEDIKLIFFSPLFLFAIDYKTVDIIASIKATKNFEIFNHIINKIAEEEKSIRQHVLDLKAKKDREDQARERAISKKRKIYGIDPLEYENQEEFCKVADKRICEVYTRKLNKIIRHLMLSEKRYKDLLYQELQALYGDSNWGIVEDIAYGDWAKENTSLYEKCQILNQHHCYCSDDDLSDDEKSMLAQIRDEYVDYRYYHDLYSMSGILSLVDFVKREVMTLPELRGPGIDRITNNTLYKNVVLQLGALNGSGDSNGWAKDRYDAATNHPIFGMHNYDWRKEQSVEYNWRYWHYTYKYSKNIGSAIELLLQIRTLQSQKFYYQRIIQNPSSGLLTFKKDNDSWSSIMQYSYWLRLGKDSRSSASMTFNLLMIKPGTNYFNPKNIRLFVDKKNKNFEHFLKVNSDRMIVTIPDSLEHASLLRLIDYVHEKSKSVIFVCESPDLAVQLKRILIDKEIYWINRTGKQYVRHVYNKGEDDWYTNSDPVYIGDYFINVDSNYYDAFFVDTPNNKEFWHRYDYSSDYKYRRKIIYSLRAIIDKGILYLKEHGIPVDNTNLNKLLLGSYSSEEDYVDFENYLVSKQGIDGRNLSDCDDLVLKTMYCERDWRKNLSLINPEALEHIDEERFQKSKKLMLLYRDLYSSDWQREWEDLPLFSTYYWELVEKCQEDVEEVKKMILSRKKETSNFDDDEILPF